VDASWSRSLAPPASPSAPLYRRFATRVDVLMAEAMETDEQLYDAMVHLSEAK
jgi:hypothetical protein